MDLKIEFSQLLKQLLEFMNKLLNESELCTVYQKARSQFLVENSKLALKYLDLLSLSPNLWRKNGLRRWVSAWSRNEHARASLPPRQTHFFPCEACSSHASECRKLLWCVYLLRLRLHRRLNLSLSLWVWILIQVGYTKGRVTKSVFFFLRSPRYIVYSQNLRAALIISITLSKVANSFLRDNRKRANVR